MESENTKSVWYKSSKVIGTVLMLIGFTISSPPGIIPDDFVNLFLGHIIVLLTGVSLLTAILMTYFIIGPAIFLLGAVIFPKSTKQVLTSAGRKVANAFGRVLTPWRNKNWLYTLGFVASILIVWYGTYIYQTWIETGIRAYLQMLGIAI